MEAVIFADGVEVERFELRSDSWTVLSLADLLRAASEKHHGRNLTWEIRRPSAGATDAGGE